MPPFDNEAYDKQKKALDAKVKDLETERARAQKLWENHAEHLSHDDRVLLHQLLHSYLHSED